MARQDLREFARSLFDIGVRAADPSAATHNALVKAPLAPVTGGRYILVAIGKAACAMMQAALTHVPKETPVIALAVTNYENHRDIPGCTVLAAGHPIPDANGLKAGQQVIDLLTAATARDKVLCLISGGGSALVPAPLPGLTLADKVCVNRVMLENGLDITETNLVRQQLSILKGGGMTELAFPASVRTLAVSDVIGDDPRTIASGPTAGPLGSPAAAVTLLKEKGLWSLMPDTVQSLLSTRAAPSPQPGKSGDLSVICSNRITLEAILSAAPHWSAEIVSDKLNGDVSDAASAISGYVKGVHSASRQLLIWGGETTVVVKGKGKGGRNQELSLHFAIENTDLPGDWVFLSGGTDGRDGPTDAAGGLVDRNTVQRIENAGGRPSALLNNNDSHAALDLADDLLVTGATGTNVADVAIFLRP